MKIISNDIVPFSIQNDASIWFYYAYDKSTKLEVFINNISCYNNV